MAGENGELRTVYEIMTAIARVLGIVCAIACGALAALGADAAHAGARVALIVGNSDYRNVTPLPNPERDAKLMANTLRDLGFTIVNGDAQLNLDKQQFDRAVQDFGNAAQGADVALFYYAGHGVQVHGANYLVPVDANPTKESDVNFQMFDANLVLRVLDSAGARLNLVILDACRNNPFRVSRLRAVSSGLAQMQAPEGTLISFATQPGNVASDGDSGHSPFTEALTITIRKPGLDIFRTFNEVGLQVAKTTGGEQQPWLSVSPIKGDFYFGGAPKVAATQPKPDPLAEQRRNYEAAERVGTKEAWASFLNAYPQGYMADLARAQRGKIVAQERAQQRAEAAAAEQARREAEAEAARKASEQAARDEAVKVAAVARARSAVETKQARAAAEKARKEAEAEKAKREAEAKAAQAEVENARREAAAARAAKQAAEIAAQEAISSLQKERATREAHMKMAALSAPSDDTNSSKPQLDSSDVVRLVKIHLQQVGCDPGSVNGVWDDHGREALTEFNKHAGTNLDVKTVSIDTLDAVRAINKRVCPLVCGKGTRREGDECVAIREKPANENRTISIVPGSARHLQLRAACQNGSTSACRSLCSASSSRYWRACRAVAKRSGGGGGRGGGRGFGRGSGLGR
jgi:hypothetical protein